MADQLPSDAFMLLSFVNTKLRDEFPSMDEFCRAMGVDETELVAKLASAGFEYSQENNKFW